VETRLRHGKALCGVGHRLGLQEITKKCPSPLTTAPKTGTLLCENETHSQQTPAAWSPDVQASLALLSPGQTGTIHSIGGPRNLRVRLMELGLLPGTRIDVVRRAPLGGPLHVTVRGCHLSIRTADAARIVVRLANSRVAAAPRGQAA
jgi:Fe2+ transport system protein FeoA